MADTYKVKVLNQKVFHDGTSMIVLKPKGENPEVEERFIAGLVEEGFIEKPTGWKAPEKAEEGEAIASADGQSIAEQVAVDPLDHDANGKKGGSKAPPADDKAP